MKLISFNVENIFLKTMNKKKLSFISNFIKDNDIDIINIQELNISDTKKLKKELTDYKFYGNFRYHKLLNFLPMNENNNIITNRSVSYYDTVKYKDKCYLNKVINFPVLPRIATILITEDYCIINTHISNKVPKIKNRQLELLKNIIIKYYKDYKLILTGDFNMTLRNTKFKEFIEYLKSLNIKRVPLNDSTWHGKNKEYTLDHIFISGNIKLKDKKIIKSDNYSDHDILYIEI